MDLLHSSKNEERKTQMKFVYILQDFNMVKKTFLKYKHY